MPPSTIPSNAMKNCGVTSVRRGRCPDVFRAAETGYSAERPMRRADVERAARVLAALAVALVASLVSPVASGEVFTESAKLLPSDGAPRDGFGVSVSVSGDVAVVGMYHDACSAGVECGSAYVYRFVPGAPAQWVLEQKLTASDAADDDYFGYAVAVSGDVVIVGAYGDDCVAGRECGSAYVYRFDRGAPAGPAWVEEAKLTASDAGAVDLFGASVSVTGNVAVIGAYLDYCGDEFFCGSAYAYRFDPGAAGGPAWVEEAKLTASDAAQEDEFGVSVSVSGDVIVVGSYADDCPAGLKCGSAYVYRFVPGAPGGPGWIEEQKLTLSEPGASDYFGTSVSVSGDVAVVGAYRDDCASGTNCGSAHVYRFDPTAPAGWRWVEEAKLTAAYAAGYYGASVAIDGDMAVVGAVLDDCVGGESCGSAYVYRFNGSAWVPLPKLAASDAAQEDWFGYSVSLSGQRAIVGAWFDDDNGTDSGSAYTFDFAAEIPAASPWGLGALTLVMLTAGSLVMRRRVVPA